MSNTIWNKKKYALSQRMRRQLSLQEAYHIKDPDTLQELLWLKRKRFGRRTDITAWYSQHMDEQNVAFILRDNAWIDAFGKFTLEVNGKPYALYKRHWLRSIFREKWTIRHPETEEEIMSVEARSWFISLIRNFRWLPVLNWFDFFIQFIRLQFDIYDVKTKNKIGYFDRKFTIGDNYILNFEQDQNNILDPMVAVALAVLLDSGENR